MKKKIFFMFIITTIVFISISCITYARYILNKKMNVKMSSAPFIFEASAEKDKVVMDTVGVDIDIVVKNFNANNEYNEYPVDYQITLEDNSKFDFQVATRTVVTRTIDGGSAIEENLTIRLIPYQMEVLNSEENITLKIASVSPYKKEIKIPININTNPYTISGIELNYLIKNGIYAPEGDVYDYYAVDANRLQDRTVKKIIFGKYSTYKTAVSGITAEPIDVNRIGVVNLYRKINSDNSTYTIYILSEDGTFELSENAAWTFDKLYALESIENLHLVNTSKVTNMRDMFCDCASLTNVDLSNFETAKVEDMIGMFARMYKIKYIDLTTFDTSSITDISQIFSMTADVACNLERIYVSDKWKIPSGANTTGMFSNCTSIIGQNGTVYNSSIVDGTRAIVDGTNAGYMCGMYNFIDGANTNNIIKGKSLAERQAWAQANRYDDTTITQITFGKTRDYFKTIEGQTPLGVDLLESGVISAYRVPNGDGTYHVYIISNSGKFVANANMSWMFDKLYGLKKINNLNLLDTSNVTQMRDLFCDCAYLESIDFSGFNTAKVTTMEGMFARMYMIKTIDLSSFNTSKVTTMLNMFYEGISTTETPSELQTATPALTTIYVSSSWSTAAIATTTEAVFNNTTQLVGGAGTKFSTSNASAVYARIDSASTPGYLTSK